MLSQAKCIIILLLLLTLLSLLLFTEYILEGQQLFLLQLFAYHESELKSSEMISTSIALHDLKQNSPALKFLQVNNSKSAPPIVTKNIPLNEKCVCDSRTSRIYFNISNSTAMKRKIFLLGFPKSATSSFHTLFKCMGYKSYHFWERSIGLLSPKIYKAYKDSKPLLYYVEKYHFNAFAQMDNIAHNLWPQIDFFQELDEEYPHSLFILPVRNIDEHIKSFKTYGRMYKRMVDASAERILSMLASGLEFDTFKIEETHVWKYIRIGKMNDVRNISDILYALPMEMKDNLFKHWMLAHYFNVEQYFSMNREREKRFLRFNIGGDVGENLQLLMDFFGCEKLRFEHSNKNRKHLRNRKIH